MSQSYLKTTLESINWSLELYDAQNELHQQFLQFAIPSWAIDNFNNNTTAKSKYQLSEDEEYSDLSEEKKINLKKEIFNAWSEGIWNIIRMRIGLRLDIIGYGKLSDSQQSLLKQAIAHQVNYWRINLPWEISQTTTRISGAISTTINATAYVSTFDMLCAATKAAIINSGISQMNIEELLTKRYREDTFLVELYNIKERVTQIEQPLESWTNNTETYLTRTEAANLYWTRSTDLLTKTEADKLYLQTDSSSSSSSFYDTEQKISNQGTTKELKNANNDALKEVMNPTSWSLELINNNNVRHSMSLTQQGFFLDGDKIPSEASILNTISNNYYSSTLSDEKFATKTLTYSKIESNSLYATKAQIANFYTSSEVDTKIASAVSSGTVDLGNYYNKTESNTRYQTKIGSVIENTAAALDFQIDGKATLRFRDRGLYLDSDGANTPFLATDNRHVLTKKFGDDNYAKTTTTYTKTEVDTKIDNELLKLAAAEYTFPAMSLSSTVPAGDYQSNRVDESFNFYVPPLAKIVRIIRIVDSAQLGYFEISPTNYDAINLRTAFTNYYNLSSVSNVTSFTDVLLIITPNAAFGTQGVNIGVGGTGFNNNHGSSTTTFNLPANTVKITFE